MPEYKPLWDDAELIALTEVWKTGQLSMFSGRNVLLLEQRLSSGCQGYEALAMSSGTAALHAALACVGVGPGDEVIVPAISYAATALAPRYLNAVPVFADVREDSLTLSAGSCRRMISKKTKAVTFVRLFGTSCGIDEVAEVCRDHGLALIEDCAQAFGTRRHDGAMEYCGDAACVSFFETKAISVGEGGAVFCRSPEAMEIARRLRHHGMDAAQGDRSVTTVGYNYKMSELHAAVALTQLAKLDMIVTEREQYARIVREALSGTVAFQQHGASERVSQDKLCLLFSSREARERAILAKPPYGTFQYLSRPLYREPVFDGSRTDGTTAISQTFCERHLVVQCSPRYDAAAVRKEFLAWRDRFCVT